MRKLKGAVPELVMLTMSAMFVIAVALLVSVVQDRWKEEETPMTEAYQPVPVEAARQIAGQYRKQVVVVFSHDIPHNRTHITTYGESDEQKDLALDMGQAIAAILNLGKSRIHEDLLPRVWVATHYHDATEPFLRGPYRPAEAKAFVAGLELGSDGMEHKTVESREAGFDWLEQSGVTEAEWNNWHGAEEPWRGEAAEEVPEHG